MLVYDIQCSLTGFLARGSQSCSFIFDFLVHWLRSRNTHRGKQSLFISNEKRDAYDFNAGGLKGHILRMRQQESAMEQIVKVLSVNDESKLTYYTAFQNEIIIHAEISPYVKIIHKICIRFINIGTPRYQNAQIGAIVII
ncbi:hypothetical protein ACTXT7_003534 [Hymenolepis weldensis]